MPASVDTVGALRRFSRFYTRQLGLLDEGLHASGYTLAEVRVLYELAQRDGVGAAELARELALDAGYLSRILRRFAARGLVRGRAHPGDARRRMLSLTAQGRRAFEPLDAASSAQAARLIEHLDAGARHGLVAAMATIERALSPAARAQRAPIVLRAHQVGDIGWIAHRQGQLYAQEYGWDETFEALVAEIGARFVRGFDPKAERCWVAEQDGRIVGAVFVVRKSARVAQLRLLYVEPAARGQGLGARLVDECIRFARAKGYRTLMLWTNAGLDAARHIYEARGFVLQKEEPHRSFGQRLVGQFWTLRL
ncbi:MAG TPA: helix-turn-helix domain-containing GNAT family N-acetyltransferase [Burkholderiaceae bacterium]|nr:helix-turn-helix domain-containing GNAT family N-acetyltransferase [Burkholderiaceae bacterium]